MAPQLTEVEFAGHTVKVPKGGYYDRYRSNPDLDEVAHDAAVGNIDWFRRIPKVQVESRVGPIWAPNFYYRASIVQATMLAPFDRLAAMLPEPLEPLRAFPGFGVVALTFFSYAVCDNDPYDEASVAVVIRKPGHKGAVSSLLPEVELVSALRRRKFYAHVLALPVTTEIARVRGVEGYQLPKWRTDISLDLEDGVQAEIAGHAGQPDVSLHTPRPEFTDVPSQTRMGTNTMIHLVDGRWHQTSVQSNTLSFAQRSLPRDVTLTRRGGPLSDLLDGLGAARILSLDVTEHAQLVLHLPRPLTIAG
ncbi:acetoacetate decarboxylase family protein [Mycobacterium koreense]|uniref:Acetoacetate decarboxylase n=1 Tax=Mycolicibacillus koreensis TaxID=1069220 RepID=A0A7I7S8I9_9MYCO|nr:acetoacetate decarboxylase family protein [Mycolicibacillus koreensis]MCV7249276.1 acetoacetate decarboxylase family protein [Mycolicibacillus koreensis]ODR10307.1 acetoacetate decarboxylase [Mycolicibacillus koreensis]OSC35635.1 acetoacetate decarboxylase [Mycolicibacillus koreensis]BBY53187.1 acetoacetate decarboxylase [Mycolicibacillus koreensis]